MGDLEDQFELFECALERPEGERSAFLDSACGGDAALRERVERLLAAHVVAEATPTRVAAELAPPPFEPRDPEAIGPYRLVERIGEGGMGVVYLAEQREPIERRVAVKLIRAEVDSAEHVARFHAERQALALMNHRGIAKILDAGVFGRQPYFVMELIDGAPLTDHCDAAELGVQQRLEVFRDVCLAVQHAHQKGIIHRDLKPSNVLVATEDGAPVPKVIDFGIAKIAAENAADDAMKTEIGRVMGTPDYMSPEQAGAAPLDIDTRTDVYSLGVLLYELLTGTRPFEVGAAIAEGRFEILRSIQEVDPQRPSTRVSTLGEESGDIASRRLANTATLSRALRGDLDWIVMKALEKDRGRRYDSPGAFADDVERYLRGEPVIAAPPSTAYRVQKFVSRNRGAVAASAAIFVLFLAGAAGTGIGWWRTARVNTSLDAAILDKSRALDREKEQRERAQENETRALAAEATARRRADETERVAELQEEQLRRVDAEVMGVRLRRDLLGAASPEVREELMTALADVNFTDLSLGVLEQNVFAPTIAAIDARFVDQPRLRARLLGTAAHTMQGLGLSARALDPAERALDLWRIERGPDSREAIDAAVELSVLARDRGDLERAEGLLVETIERSERVLGDEDPSTLVARHSFAVVLESRGRFAEAEELLLDVLDVSRHVYGADHPEMLRTLDMLGSVLTSTSRFDDAEPLIREAAESRLRLLGPEDPQTLLSQTNLGMLLRLKGDAAGAEECYRGVLEVSRRRFGEEHPLTRAALLNLAQARRFQRDFAGAEEILRESLEVCRRVLGDDHPDTLIAIGSLGGILRLQGRYEEAEPYYVEALERRTRKLGPDHVDTLGSVNNMGYLLQAMGKPDEAEPYMRDALVGMRRVLGPGHRATLGAASNLGYLMEQKGEFDEAESLYRDSLQGRRRLYGDGHDVPRASAKLLQELLQRRIAASADAPGAARVAAWTAERGGLLVFYGSYVEAESELTLGLELLVEADSVEPWRLVAATSDLGLAIAAQGRREEAEPLVLEGAEAGLDPDVIPPDLERWGKPLGEALTARAALFYEEWEASAPGEGYADEAATWSAAIEASAGR
ncbi:MAG: serine/threonine-protein kinase [Planctomycetota bacterium]